MKDKLVEIGLCTAILAAVVGLGGCALPAAGMEGASARGLGSMAPASKADFEHFIGEWDGVFTGDGGYSFSDHFVFRRDGTYTDTADFPPVMVNAGTVVIDPATKTLTFTITAADDPSIVGLTNTASYSFSTNHKILTITQAEGVGAGTGVYAEQ